MKKLDLYIIKKYLKTFLFTVMIFSMISVIIDFSGKIDDFIEEDCTLYQIIVDYYFSFILYINGLLIPLYAMISVIFFTSRLAYDSEIISVLNAGVSFRRLLRPYLIAAGLIAGFHLVSNHYLIPRSNKIRLDFEHEYIWKYSDKGKTNDVHIFLGPETKVYIKYYQKRDSTARDMRIEKIKNNKLVKLVKANKAEWVGPPNQWRLSDYEIRTFDGLKESIQLGDKQKMDTTLNLTPGDFVRYQNLKEMMDSPELTEFIRIEKSRGMGNTKQFEIERHRRSAEPVTILILTLIGVSVASRKVRGGMGLHLALGVSIGAAFIFIARFSNVFASNESLTPFLGVWIPNIIFFFIALFLVSKAQK